jgi:hypothetical protein
MPYNLLAVTNAWRTMLLLLLLLLHCQSANELPDFKDFRSLNMK